jgi:hypothetical protein
MLLNHEFVPKLKLEIETKAILFQLLYESFKILKNKRKNIIKHYLLF